MQISDAGDTVVKTAETDEERRRLSREADVLRRVAHPGIVRLVATEGDATPDGTDRLVFAKVAGSTLADLGPQPPAVVAAWAAAVATILADLHDVGWVHGNLRPEHVLLDDQGRPVLCGFSRAERIAWGQTGARPSDRDLRGLDENTFVRLIVDGVSTPNSAVHRALSRWERRRRRGGLRSLALDLSNEAGAAMVGPGAGRPRTGRRLLVAAGAAGLSVSGVIGLIALSSARSAGQAKGDPVNRTNSATSADSAAPAEEVAVPSYLLEPGRGVTAISAIGTWGCGPSRPAVLDPASGQVWVFSAVPGPGSSTTGIMVAHVPGATGLSVEAGAGGCDRLTVLRGLKPGIPMSLRADG